MALTPRNTIILARRGAGEEEVSVMDASQVLTLIDGTELEVTYRAVKDGVVIAIEAFVNDTVRCRDVELTIQR